MLRLVSTVTLLHRATPHLAAAGATGQPPADAFAPNLATTERGAPKLGPRPVKPYRAWCWSPHTFLSEHPELYPGVNLNLMPGGGGNTSVATAENAAGIATLHYADGPELPYFAKFTDNASSGATNNTGATPQFEASLSPGPAALPGETDSNASFYFAGSIIDEWNPDPCIPTQVPSNIPGKNWTVPGPFIRPGQSQWCNNSAAALAGYIKARIKFPTAFNAAWVSQQDHTFEALMLSGVFDLNVIEGFIYNPGSNETVDLEVRRSPSLVSDGASVAIHLTQHRSSWAGSLRPPGIRQASGLCRQEHRRLRADVPEGRAIPR